MTCWRLTWDGFPIYLASKLMPFLHHQIPFQPQLASFPDAVWPVQTSERVNLVTLDLSP